MQQGNSRTSTKPPAFLKRHPFWPCLHSQASKTWLVGGSWYSYLAAGECKLPWKVNCRMCTPLLLSSKFFVPNQRKQQRMVCWCGDRERLPKDVSVHILHIQTLTYVKCVGVYLSVCIHTHTFIFGDLVEWGFSSKSETEFLCHIHKCNFFSPRNWPWPGWWNSWVRQNHLQQLLHKIGSFLKGERMTFLSLFCINFINFNTKLLSAHYLGAPNACSRISHRSKGLLV